MARTMLARDIMSSPVVAALPSDDLQKVARRMVDNAIGCLPVIDAEGKLVGIVTESDYQAEHGYAPFSLFEMPRLFHRFIDLEGLERIYAEARAIPVSRIMRQPPLTMADDTPIEKVAAAMLEHGIHHIPILRGGQVVGIIARRDLLKVMAGRGGKAGR